MDHCQSKMNCFRTHFKPPIMLFSYHSVTNLPIHFLQLHLFFISDLIFSFDFMKSWFLFDVLRILLFTYFIPLDSSITVGFHSLTVMSFRFGSFGSGSSPGSVTKFRMSHRDRHQSRTTISSTSINSGAGETKSK